ncbi:MAG: hypothetical protein IJ836_00310 [Spirochaetales bacterium]|nr:hypothetical protein [Spirochaetales bacterium]
MSEKKELLEFKRVVNSSAIIYLGLPFCLFLLFWVRPVIAIPLFLIMCISIIKAIHNEKKQEEGQHYSLSKNEWYKLLIAWCVIIVWVYLSGIGGFVFQNTDHIWRNTIFNILVKYDWPVVTKLSVDGVTETRGLVYYIGFWLPAALIGKLTSIGIGNIFQLIWASLGIFLFYCGVCIYRKKIEIWPLLLFIFFSTIDIVGWVLGVFCWGHKLTLGTHIDCWYKFEYSCITKQLFWVFNQAMPAWLCFLAVLNSRNNRNIVLLLGLVLICSPLPFIGLLPYAVYVCLSRKYGEKFISLDYFKALFKDTFTFQNFFGGGISGILTFLYLMNNDSGQAIGAPNNTTRFLNDYLLFIALEVLAFIIILFFFHKKNYMYYLTCMLLLLFPFGRIGNGGDFCMRASIPALIMLYLLCLEALDNPKPKLLKFALIFILCIGAITPINEFARTIINTAAIKKGSSDFVDYIIFKDVIILQNKLGVYGYMKELPEEMIMTGGNFSGNAEKSLFFKYFAKR